MGDIAQPVLAPAPPAPSIPPAPVLNPVPSVTQLKGVDVSSYQGLIDWVEVKASGITFAFIKATEGLTLVDANFKTNWSNAKEAGVIVGAYHYFHPSDDPVLQANHFLSTIGQLDNTDLPPALDFEVLDKASVTAAATAATTWLQLVEGGSLKNPIVYSDLGFFEQLNLPTTFKSYPLWQAEWNSKITSVATPWSYVSFWQNSSSGQVPGIPTIVDTDIFFGSLNQLQKLCSG